MKAVFISGLNGSGTTVVDLILGSHPDMIAVGEVENVIKTGRDRKGRPWGEEHFSRCTCGKRNFWPTVVSSLDGDLIHRYKIFLDQFSRRYPHQIPVDSSKIPAALDALGSSADVKLIKVTRDVRGWCLSSTGRVTLAGMLYWYRRILNWTTVIPKRSRSVMRL